MTSPRSQVLLSTCFVSSFTSKVLTPKYLSSTIPCPSSARMSVPAVTFVTGNKNKLREVSQILNADSSQTPFTITSQKVDLPELQGDPDDIVREKCRIAVGERSRALTLVEDTCLCFNALKGLPGPYIKWFWDRLGHDGLNQMLAGFDDKSAYALCTFAYSSGKAGTEPIVFSGATEGKIVPPRHSPNGKAFGWDPIFEPAGFDQTFAEMDKETKNSISHRFKALAKVREHLTKEFSD
uniref:Inosine triphosphate pyrophosphatase n=1 Tax=Griffithsia japonica TaxID=83288 RepID=Q7XZ73_GRIJA|nr:inosine triphosphatase [Griffithsia japonica]